MANQGTVRIVFEGDASSLQSAVSRSDAALSKFSSTTTQHGTALKSADEESSRFSKTTSSLGGALKSAALAAGGTAVAYIGISQAETAISTTEDLAKATISLHENLGLATKEASEWAAVAQTRGVDSTKLGMAFKTLATNITAARDGSASAGDALKTLGFSVHDVDRASTDTTFAVKQVADGLANLKGGADKAAISGRLFGRGWQTVQPILRDGSAAMQEQLDMANKYGAAFGGKAVNSFKDLIASERELKMAQLGLQVQFTEHIAPALIDAGLALAHFINDMRRGKGAGGDFANIMKGVGTVLSRTVKGTVDTFNILRDDLRWLGRGISNTVQAISLDFGSLSKDARGDFRVLLGMWHGLGKGISSIGKGIAGTFRGVAHAVRDVVQFIVNAVNKAVGALNDLKDKIPSVSLPNIPGTSIGPSDIPVIGGLFARGGQIPGVRDGDRVPIMAEEGEFFVNKRATAMYRPLLEAINRGMPRFGSPRASSPGKMAQGGWQFSSPLMGGARQPAPAWQFSSPFIQPPAWMFSSPAMDATWTPQKDAIARLLGRFVHGNPSPEGALGRIHRLNRRALGGGDLPGVLQDLADELHEQNAHLKDLERVGRAEDFLKKALTSVVMGTAGQGVGLGGLQAAGVPGHLATY